MTRTAVCTSRTWPLRHLLASILLQLLDNRKQTAVQHIFRENQKERTMLSLSVFPPSLIVSRLERETETEKKLPAKSGSSVATPPLPVLESQSSPPQLLIILNISIFSPYLSYLSLSLSTSSHQSLVSLFLFYCLSLSPSLSSVFRQWNICCLNLLHNYLSEQGERKGDRKRGGWVHTGRG